MNSLFKAEPRGTSANRYVTQKYTEPLCDNSLAAVHIVLEKLHFWAKYIYIWIWKQCHHLLPLWPGSPCLVFPLKSKRWDVGFRNPNLVTHEERRDPICHLFWSVTERREISLSPSFCNFWNASAGVKRSAYLMLKDQFTPRHQIVFICSLSCRIELQSKTSPWKWIKRKHEMAPWILCRIIWGSGRSKTDFKRDYLHPLVRRSFCCSSWSNKCTPFSVD